MEVPVYYFFYGDFPDVELFASQRYIHVVEEGPTEFIFDHSEAPAFKRAVVQPHIAEGKDRPAQLGPKLHSDLGRTVALVLWVCESLFSTRKAVVMDSGFCVTNEIVALAAKGVYAGALIKKRRYWPKGVPGDLVDQYFPDKKVGDVDMLVAATKYCKPFQIFCFK